MTIPPTYCNGKGIIFLRGLIGHQSDACVKWPFATNHKGYGMLGYNGRPHKANRLMCELAHGPAPTPKHQATHNCGNGHKGCVNPKHLEWKTNLQNQMDRAEHGTMRKKDGIKRKLTAEQIAEVRALKGQVAQYDLAKRFGVKPGCIEYWQSHDKPPALPTAETCRKIREIGRSQPTKKTAEQFGLTVGSVNNILAGRSYRDDAAA